MTSHQFNWDVDTWTALDSYYGQNKILTQHQLESFNNLVDYVIPQIIEKNNPVVIATDYSKDLKDFKKKCTIKFMQTYLSKPLIHENSDVIKPLYPNEARLRNLTYAAPMFIDVECTITDASKAEKTDAGKPEYERRIPFLKLPIMLHSKYCHLSDRTETGLTELGECEYDQGGYFIVNGGEKVLISQERVAENQVFVWTPPKTTTSKYTHEAEIKSSIDQRFYPVKTNKVKLTKEPTSNIIKDANKQGVTHGRTLHVQMPYIKDSVPLFIMFRALGVATEKEMFEMIMPDHETIGSNYLNFLIPSVDEARIATVIIGDNREQVMTQQQALNYLAERLNITFTADFKKQHADAQIKYVKDILSRELFPHIGQMSPSIGHTFRKKAFFLGYMTRKLIDCYFGVRPYDDRDHYGNKRVDLAGPLITSLFRTHFIKLIRDIRKDILPKLTGGGEIDKNGVMLILRKTIQGCNIDSKIKYGLSTGNWSTQKTSLSTSKKGIAQVLNRMSFAGALSHTRRIQSPLERAGSKIVPPRRLHGTHFGMCCPNETPEGQQIGIVKNLAMQTHVTIQTSDYPIRIILNKLGVIDLIETVAVDVNHSTKIFVNGDWFGVIGEDRTRQLYHRLKTLKRHGVIVPYISIAWFICWNEIHIQTDGGRYSRPLYAVENGLIVEDGHISEKSFVDECQLLIECQCQDNESFYQKFTHGELKWPQFLFGFHDGTFDVKTASIDNGGVIEYLDTNEIETSMVAMTRADMNANSENNNYYVRYTHCEIHPMMMMGVISAVIPFSDHNQSPRNCYQCLWKEEEVIMNDGSVKKISEIKVGDYVITVDPMTLKQKPAKVINQYIKTTEKKIVKVTTISGRTIICTEDHPILTYNGWKDAGKLTEQDLVCVCPNLVSYPLDKADLVLDKDRFITELHEKDIKYSLITDHLNQLNILGILPLYQNSPAIPILARIFGFCMTDGSIEICSCVPRMTMTFGSSESGEEYLKDVESLGFQRNKMTEVLSKIHSWQVTYNNSLVSLIIALGKRTECPNNEVPEWIKQGSKLVKREFLAGFLGGNGCKIGYKHLKDRKFPNLILSVTPLTSCSAHLNNLKIFVDQIKQLFNEFGVTFKDTKVRSSKSYTIELPFKHKHGNIINYFEKIGYRYDLYKYRDNLLIYEYLKYLQSLVNQIDEWKTKITELKNKSKPYPELTSQLGLDVIECANLHNESLCRKRSHIPNDYLPIDVWLNIVKKENNSIFVPINKVESHENVEIADITIDADTHSFITGQHICVHNSSMAKQSIGYYATNYNSRMDTMAHVLVYGHKPLVSTRLAKYALMDKLPHGETAMLLYACYTGYNQEDSIVINKDAVERGFFNTLFFRSYTDKAQKHRSVTTATERFTKPDKKTTRGIKVHGSYDAIDNEGRPIVGKIVKGNDVIIGKVIELKEKDPENFSNKDVSTTTRPNEYGTIDKVIHDTEGGVLPYNADGHRFIKARVSILRKPEIGDKFACFDDKTQVLTNKDWKFFKDLELSDQVACMENGKLVYAYPTDLQSYHVIDQMMYTVETQQINLKVTPNHRMYVKKRSSEKFIIDEAQNLFNQRLKFKKNCEYIPSNWCGDKFTFSEGTRIRGNGYEKLDEYVIDMDHWLTFFGIWITEGWTDVGSECDDGYITVSADKSRVKLALEKLEINLGWHFIKCESNDKWKLSNIQIYQYLQPLSVGATNKYLPEWVWQLNQNQANLLLNSMCIGDEHKSKSNTHLYYTGSTKLANDFQRLALHAGLSANIHVRSEVEIPYEIKGHNEITITTAYYITIVKSKNEPQINRGCTSEKQDKWEQYTGQVYCCTVPSGIIYVRREGIPEWLGNSRYSQKGTAGILYRSIDMPFTCYGLVPDIIMNPHGIPSRMTVGKLLETLLGKVAVSSGQFQDATPFVSYDFEKFKQTLKLYGMDELGNEVMYNGQTGEMFDAVFFYGPTYYQRLKHMVDDKVHCLTLDHEVLTSHGWKFFQQLTMDDEIATLKNGKLVYDKPIKLLFYPDYSGKLYHIKNQQVDLNVTTNHRMWVSRPYGHKKEWQPYQLVTAEEINTKHVKYQKDAEWDAPDYQFMLPTVGQQNEKLVDMNAWLTFFGIWIDEGWTTPDYHVHICQYKEKVIFDAIEKLGYLQSHSNDDKITICDEQLHSYLSTYSVGVFNKYLPNWVWHLSQQQCRTLIYNMQLGNRIFTKSDNNCYYTSSARLADDFMRLCLHAGFSSNKTKHLENSHTTSANYDIWQLSVITTKNRPSINHGQQIQIEEINDFNGLSPSPVFCLQVPSEVFYVRRNGLPVWTGNSRESGPVQLLTRQPAEGRSREGGLRLGEMEKDCFIAHGIPKFLKERMMDSSDLFKAYVSKKEETLIIGNPEQRIFKFNGQNIKDDEVMQIQLPYAMKLLLQELQSMGLDMRLHMS